MSEQIPSQGSPSDPDDAWDRAQEKYDTAFDNLLDQLGDIGIGVGEAFNVNVDPEEISYEEIEDIYAPFAQQTENKELKNKSELRLIDAIKDSIDQALMLDQYYLLWHLLILIHFYF